jgi:triacylglycerol lipase
MTKFSEHFSGVKPGKRYDPQTALSLAVACDLAYDNKAKINKAVESWGYEVAAYVDVKKGRSIDTQGFVMANASDIVCVFRGSDKIEDWFANFEAVRDPGPLNGTLVHEGFQDALFPAVIAITNAIDIIGASDKRIWLTGHSLGGALSSLYAGMMLENGYSIYGIYTFASPRPGDDMFADTLNTFMASGPHYRVVNDGDIVPHLPPEPFFSHPGKRILLNYRSRETSKSAWTELREKMFKVLMDMTGRPWEIADNHRLDSDKLGYIPRLASDLKRQK